MQGKIKENLTICRITIFVQGREKRNNKSSLSLSVCGSSIHLNYYFDSIMMSVLQVCIRLFYLFQHFVYIQSSSFTNLWCLGVRFRVFG